jgi:glutaredoxin 3
MPDRIMYVKPGCPYCQHARDGMAAEGIAWEERDATASPEWRAELMRHSRNSGVVPTIVRGEEVVTVGWKGGG